MAMEWEIDDLLKTELQLPTLVPDLNDGIFINASQNGEGQSVPGASDQNNKSVHVDDDYIDELDRLLSRGDPSPQQPQPSFTPQATITLPKAPPPNATSTSTVNVIRRLDSPHEPLPGPAKLFKSESLLPSTTGLPSTSRSFTFSSIVSTKTSSSEPVNSSPFLLQSLGATSVTKSSGGLFILPQTREASGSAWNSAVVAQLGTLKPCTPPPTAKGLTITHHRLGTSTINSNESVIALVSLSSASAVPPSLTVTHVKSHIENDSGVESIDSLSPKDISPICSPSESVPTSNPAAPKQEESILSALLSAPSQPTKSSELLTSLLNNTAPTSLGSILTSSAPTNPPPEERRIVAVNPNDIYCKDSTDQVLVDDIFGGEGSSLLRSALEDINPSQIVPPKNVQNVHQKVADDGINENGPTWDADINWRLQLLDSDLNKLKNGGRKEKTRRFPCPLCAEEFESAAARADHKVKAHPRRHLCTLCDVPFSTGQKLERHLLTHKSSKDFKCQTCGREFLIEKNLLIHQKVHLGLKDFVCDICGKPYFTKSGLASHHRQNHSPPNETNCGEEVVEGSEFVCVKCEPQEKFPTRYDLDTHRKQQHQLLVDDQSMKCPNCKTTFKNVAQLKRHIMNAHCERPYKCPSCPHRSKTKTNLEKHMSCHTNKESFQCLHCQRKFAFKNSLKKHLEKGRCSVLKEQQKKDGNNKLMEELLDISLLDSQMDDQNMDLIFPSSPSFPIF